MGQSWGPVVRVSTSVLGIRFFLVGRVVDQDPAYFHFLPILMLLLFGWWLALIVKGWGSWDNIFGDLLHTCLGLSVFDLIKLLLLWTCNVEGGLGDPLATFGRRGDVDGEGAIDVNAVEVEPNIDFAEHVPLICVDVHLLYTRGQVQGDLWVER